MASLSEPAPWQYNRVKNLDVDSVSGTPTVGKAQPIICVHGDDSTTGTGDIILDFSNIADAQDIAVYDQNGNLLDYEIELLNNGGSDGTGGKAVLWCYNSWVRDGSTQAQVAYGSNSANTDRQNVKATWPSDAIVSWHLDEDSGQTIDSTKNNNDSTSTTGTTYNASGEFDGARGFDGTDDHVYFGDIDATSNLTVITWINTDTTSSTGSDSDDYVFTGGFDGTNSEFEFGLRDSSGDGTLDSITFANYDGSFHGSRGDIDIPGTLSTNTWYQLAGVYDNSNTEYRVYWDGSQAGNSISDSTGPADALSTANWALGALDANGSPGKFWDGRLDAARAYSSAKSADWMQADYDASPKAGQVFFSQQAAKDAPADPRSSPKQGFLKSGRL